MMVGGPGGDFISPYSGDVETPISVGPSLKAGGGLELGLTLHHSSKIWTHASWLPNAGLKRRGAFGVGWKLHLGRVYQACNGGSCSGTPEWVYEAPDGATHELGYPRNASSDPNAPLLYFGTSTDGGIYIRAEALNGSTVLPDDPNQWGAPPDGWRLFMGNGIVHTFTRTLASSGDGNHDDPSEDPTDDFRGWYVTKIERWDAPDHPAGQITVTYGSGATAHCMSSIEFRTLPLDTGTGLLTERRRITFQNRSVLPDPGGSTIEGGYTHRIDFPALNGTAASTASYTFNYSGPHTLVFKPTSSTSQIEATGQFLLTSIDAPLAGYSHSFGYDLDASQDADPSFPSTITGELVTRTLPTGATLKYLFGTYLYNPTLTSDVSYLREVRQKSVHLGDPNAHSSDPNTYIGKPEHLDEVGFWLFTRFRGGTGLAVLWSKILDTFNNETVYDYQGEPGQPGKILTFRGRASQAYGGVADAKLVRTGNTLYSGAIPWAEWTILHDEQDKMLQVQRLDSGPFGQFGRINEFDLHAVPLASPLLTEDVVPYRATLNSYAPLVNKTDDRWKLWSFSRLVTQTVIDGLGAAKRKTTWTYENDGRLRTATRFINPSSSDPNATGNIRTETVYDTNNLNVDRSFTSKLGEPGSYGTRQEYHMDGVFPWRSYVLDPNNPTLPGSKAFVYESGEVADRDPNSGLVKATLDPSDVRADLEYDLLGRPTRVDPAGAELPVTTTYPSPNEVVITRTDGGSNTIQSKTTLDALGRAIQVSRRTESGTCETKQTTTYDIVGRATFVSEWGFDSVTGCSTTGHDPNTEFYSAASPRGTLFDYFRNATYWGDTSAPDPNTIYDPLGRLLGVTTADGKSTESRYAGLGTTVTIGSVGLVGGDAPVSTYYERDAFGNLVHVDAPEGADAAYTYNIVGELTQVELHGFDPNAPSQPVTQVRSFVYDSLGRLQSATNPESGTVQYTQYDAMGRIKQKVESDGTVFSYSYDAAGRPLATSAAPDPNAATHQLAKYTYEDPNVPSTYAKLTVVDSFDEVGALLSRRSLSYGGLNGRLSEDAITLNAWDGIQDPNNPGSFDKTFRTCMSGYDNLGQLVALRYPSDAPCGTFPSTVAKLEYTYSNGSLVGITDSSRNRSWITGVTYNPVGGVRKIVHGNGRATSVVPDQMLRPKAIGVLLNPSGDDYGAPGYASNTMLRTGAYSYDGAGNITSIGPDQNNTTDSFKYDALSRLKEATVYGDPAGPTLLGYSFDDFGNIKSTTKSVNGSPVSTPSMSVSQTTNRLQAFNGYTSHYDQRGNMLGDSSKQQLFDERNRLLAAGEIDELEKYPVGQYAYDAGGERVVKQKPGTAERTFYIRDAGGNVLTELTLPPRKYDEYLQKDYVYALGRVIGMAEEKAPGPVQSIDLLSHHNALGGWATVSWQFNPAQDNVTAYRVFRKTGTGGSWVQRGGDLPSSTPSLTETTSQGQLTSGQTYFYRVAAVNSLGLEGIPSRVLKVVMAADTAPQPPIDANLETHTRSMVVRWKPSSGDGIPAADGLPLSTFIGYHVYRKVTGGVLQRLTLLPLTDTTFHDLDPTLSVGTTYEYHVMGINSRGQYSTSAVV
ncbi:MAG: hypothetical protein ACREAA_17765, partial [Candidatus Polarisedimenticolia bacterium]